MSEHLSHHIEIKQPRSEGQDIDVNRLGQTSLDELEDRQASQELDSLHELENTSITTARQLGKGAINQANESFEVLQLDTEPTAEDETALKELQEQYGTEASVNDASEAADAKVDEVATRYSMDNDDYEAWDYKA